MRGVHDKLVLTKSWLAGVLLLFSIASPAAEIPNPPRRELIFGMTPIVGVEATTERFQPLARHMSDLLGRSVHLRVADSYGKLADWMAAGKVDLAKFSPLAYVRARRNMPDMQLIATHVAYGSVDYSSYLVSLTSGRFTDFDKLKGARFCFADPSSTSGYLYPVSYLRRRGYNPSRDFRSITFAGNHQACLDGLLTGEFDVAASFSGALREARATRKDVGGLVIVAKTGRIPYDAYCLRPGLDPELADRIRSALLSISTLSREGRRVLSPALGINGWVPIEDEAYDGVRRVEVEAEAQYSE